MAPGYQALTEKEKQTLRLLLAGHDAKSMARHLQLSVHTINERLRDARRKLSASSSREAARLLREAEGAHPENLGDKTIRDAGDAPSSERSGRPKEGSSAKGRAVRAIGGLTMISFAIALFALSPSFQPTPESSRAAGAASLAAPAAETAVTGTAREWLALVDAGKWPESYAATGKSFRSLNSLQAWQSASEKARVPLGRAVSRTLIAEQTIPAPPNGYQLVRFQTSFANEGDAIESLSLSREDGGWRVVGYVID